MRAGFADLLAYLPQGNSLPADVWAVRHRAILFLVFFQATGLFLYTLVQGYELSHAFFEAGLIVLAPALAEGLRVQNQTLRSTAASLGLITSSAVLTHLSGGYIEAHFHFFVMLAVIALYQSWVPFLLSILYVLVHHGVVGLVAPESVFNHPDAIAHPWKWAAIHAGFVSAACAAYMVAWRWNETAQAQSRHILNAAGDGIIGLDPRGNVLFMNPAAMRLAGGQTPRFESSALARVLRIADSNTRDPESLPLGLPFTDAPPNTLIEGTMVREGSALPIELVRTTMLERSKVVGEVITVRDITPRMEAEKALRASEQRFRSLVQNGSDLIAVVDADTLVSYISPSIERLLGYSADDVMERKLIDLFHPEDVPQFVSFLTDAMARPNRAASIEARARHASGLWHDLEIVGTDQRTDPASAASCSTFATCPNAKPSNASCATRRFTIL